jgi:CRP/FNR family transcriptional regulator
MLRASLQSVFTQFPSSLSFFKELEEIATFVSISEQTVLIKEHTYVKQIPIVLEGLVKVYKEEENGNEILLYYIAPGESCILSIVTAEKNEKSKIKSVVEDSAKLLLIPIDKIKLLQTKHPEWNRLVYSLFDEKFQEVINRIKTLTFSTKIKRLYEYLIYETELKNTNTLHHSHQEIANELGSSREVISRLLKKLENDGKITLSHRKIQVL